MKYIRRSEAARGRTPAVAERQETVGLKKRKKNVTEEGQRVAQEMKSDVDSCY